MTETCSPPLPAPAHQIFYARKADGGLTIFAGTEHKLYQLCNPGPVAEWIDVSDGLVKCP